MFAQRLAQERWWWPEINNEVLAAGNSRSSDRMSHATASTSILTRSGIPE
jgi:hypothetical protein